MRLRHLGTRPREIVGYGIVAPGATVEIGDATAVSLVDQGRFEPVDKKDAALIQEYLTGVAAGQIDDSNRASQLVATEGSTGGAE